MPRPGICHGDQVLHLLFAKLGQPQFCGVHRRTPNIPSHDGNTLKCVPPVAPKKGEFRRHSIRPTYSRGGGHEADHPCFIKVGFVFPLGSEPEAFSTATRLAGNSQGSSVCVTDAASAA